MNSISGANSAFRPFAEFAQVQGTIVTKKYTLSCDWPAVSVLTPKYLTARNRLLRLPLTPTICQLIVILAP